MFQLLYSNPVTIISVILKYKQITVCSTFMASADSDADGILNSEIIHLRQGISVFF